ncbi:translation initiation factor IF-2-like [Pipra filicauda]|uniref:Translation initiation factor IF-2-like n=1 Tax=Pipra filicauda TaxID=649802 RepID=A0A7R5L0M9_9PASS|nr:translation initiation factor IF-2-like [Pipra filicauda]
MGHRHRDTGTAGHRERERRTKSSSKESPNKSQTRARRYSRCCCRCCCRSAGAVGPLVRLSVPRWPPRAPGAAPAAPLPTSPGRSHGAPLPPAPRQDHGLLELLHFSSTSWLPSLQLPAAARTPSRPLGPRCCRFLPGQPGSALAPQLWQGLCSVRSPGTSGQRQAEPAPGEGRAGASAGEMQPFGGCSRSWEKPSERPRPGEVPARVHLQLGAAQALQQRFGHLGGTPRVGRSRPGTGTAKGSSWRTDRIRGHELLAQLRQCGPVCPAWEPPFWGNLPHIPPETTNPPKYSPGSPNDPKSQ